MNNYVEKIRRGDSLTNFHDVELRETVNAIEGELSTDTTTIEGNPLNFTTLSAQTAKSTILSLEPIQDLHGYDKPWVGGAGKNLYAGSPSFDNYSNIEYWTKDTTSYNGHDAYKKNTAWAGLYKRFYLPIGTYVFSLMAKADASISAAFYITQGSDAGRAAYTTDESTSRTISQSWNKYSIKFTITSAGYVSCRIETITDGTMFYLTEYQLESASSATSYEPYENICPISGRTEIGILGCGKNLCTGMESGTRNTNGVKTDSDIRCRSIDIFTLYKNNIYTISATTTQNKTVEIAWILWETTENGNNTKIYDSGFIATPAVIELTNNTNISIGLRYSDNSTINTNDIKVQVEQGSTATPYSPYTKSTDLTISLGQTVYGGTLDVENGVLVVENTRLNAEDLTWTYESSVNSMTAETLSNLKSPASDTEAANVITSFSKVIPSSQRISDTTPFRTFVFTNNQRIYVRDSGYTDANAFVSALTGQTICYELAEPITINLTPHTINLLKGVNNISTDGDSITLTYRDGSVATLGDLTSAVDSLDSKIDESKILTDTATGDKYILVVTNGTLSIEQISN